jgi:predicted transcriptional regulator YdeE
LKRSVIWLIIKKNISSHVDTSDEQGIFKTRKKIWDQEDSELLEWAYTYDFEKYTPNGEFEIYIALE